MSPSPARKPDVAPLAEDEARQLTARIKGYVTEAWALLLEAYDRQAHVALGYETWEGYVRGEFDMDRVYSYRLLDQGRVIHEIQSAVLPAGNIDAKDIAEILPERVVRDLKPQFSDFSDNVARRMKKDPEASKTAEGMKRVLREAVVDERAKAKQRLQDRKALTDLSESMRDAGMDMDEQRIAQRGAFARLCNDIAALPEPIEFIEWHGSHLTKRHVDAAEGASAWLTSFLLLKPGDDE